MMKLLVFLFTVSFTAQAQSFSFLESYLGEQQYKQFLQEQRVVEKTCSHISATYKMFYMQELIHCQVVKIDGKPLVLAHGPHGELSKAELYWLQKALNLNSSKTKLNFIMSGYQLQDDLNPSSSFAFEIEFLF